MTTKKLTTAATVLVMVLSLGSAALACDCVPEDTKGNNGWGNGTDANPDGSGGTNNGSFTGATKDTKSINGPATDKFEGR